MVKYLINSIQQSVKEIRSEIKLTSTGMCECIYGYINQGYYFNGKLQFSDVNGDDNNFVEISNLSLLIKLKAEEYPTAILKYCQYAILNKSISQIYTFYPEKQLTAKYICTWKT